MNFRPLLVIAVGLTAGILAFEAYRSIGLPGSSFFAALILILIAAFAILFSFFKGRNSVRTLFVLSFLAALLRMSTAMPVAVEPGEYELTGVVSEISETGGSSVVVTGAALDGNRLNFKVLLSIQGEEAVVPEVGDRIEATCRVKEPSGGHDQWTLNRLSGGIGLRARCKHAGVVSKGNLPFSKLFSQARSFLKERIGFIFEENPSFVSAFLLGDRAELEPEDVETFRITGTAHLICLSGFHVGLIVTVLMLLIPKRSSKLRFGIVAGFLFLYCCVTNFPASLVRASIMCLCVLLAEVTERRRDSLSSLSLAAVVILLVQPYALWSAGFRLSFAATMGILFAMDGARIKSGSFIGDRFRTSLIVTASAYATTMFITARYFGYVNTYSIPVNLLALPVYSLAIELSFVCLVIGIPLPTVSRFIAWLPDKMIGGTNFVLSKAASLPFAQVAVRPPMQICGVLMLLMLFIISPYILRPIKQRLRIASPVMFLFTASVILSIIGT